MIAYRTMATMMGKSFPIVVHAEDITDAVVKLEKLTASQSKARYSLVHLEAIRGHHHEDCAACQAGQCDGLWLNPRDQYPGTAATKRLPSRWLAKIIARFRK